MTVETAGLPKADTEVPEKKGRGPGRPRKDPNTPPPIKAREPMYEEILWREAMLVAMESFQVRAPQQLNACEVIAEEYIQRWRKRFA